MSVNGLGHVSRAHITSRREKSAPLKFQSNRIHNVHVQRDQQTDGALIPTAKNKTSAPHYQARRPLPQRETRIVTHHKAVAAKHIVLPTYIGSRSTLNGKPSTRESMRMPK